MKLFSYRPWSPPEAQGAAPRLGVVRAGRFVDAGALARRGGAPPVDTMAAYLALDAPERARFARAVEAAEPPPEAMLPLPVRWAPPAPAPGKIICVGLNYYDHCAEQGVPPPRTLVTFAKYATALLAHEEAITWPPEASSEVDYEAELAIVIGKACKGVRPEEALGCIAGYTLLNDVSARDVQFRERQWVRSKSFDTFCPTGPFLVTADEIPDPHALGIVCRLNGEVVQSSSTAEMIFKAPEIIARLSEASTLLPGDLIATGTPGGVGVFRKPPRFLRPGDLVEVEIEKLGILRNPVV